MPETDFALYCGQSFLRADVILAATFYFHDYETWGADPKKDRPAQFAGLRTDLALNPLGEAQAGWCLFFSGTDAAVIVISDPAGGNQKATADQTGTGQTQAGSR